VFLVDVPTRRRGRPAKERRPPEPRPLSQAGVDVDDLVWSSDGRAIATSTYRAPDFAVAEIHLLDVASGHERRVAGGGDEHATGPRALPGGGFLYLTDADGWFQVGRLTASGRRSSMLTSGRREHGEPSGGFGYAALPSPDGSRFVHADIHDALIDLVVAPLAPSTGGADQVVINPWPGVWRSAGWTADGAWIVAIGESETAPQDVWLLPVPGVAPADARARQVTTSMPAAVAAAFGPGRTIDGERFEFEARDGLRIEGTLWRAPGGRKVPAILYPHGGPTWQAYRAWLPIKQLLAREGYASVDVDFRGSTGYGREFRRANRGEWGHADTFDMIDAAHWVLKQPWSDGRLAIYGGSYGGYLVLCALVEEPALWRAGVDLFGDSEIAESYRHGDRAGRLDLGRQMGSPDDPSRAELYRRGSPVYRAERIEAPVLILHGRKDRRVVPLMTEKMVEALEIEGKHHEVHWYDDEGHGWEQRANKRDAFNRIRSFLRRHVLDEPEPEPDDGSKPPTTGGRPA
jgi:dipeptidyl aminopeptidase/acylaminoacyl peptidase